MTRRATLTQAELSRRVAGMVAGALKAGMPVGTFKVVVENDRAELLPIAANAPLNEAEDMERRMRDAFGE